MCSIWYFKNSAKKALSTCFWGLCTVHRFVSSRITVVALSKTGSAKHSSNKSAAGPQPPRGPSKVRPAHCLQWAVPPGGRGEAQDSQEPGVSACDGQAHQGHASKRQPCLSDSSVSGWFCPAWRCSAGCRQDWKPRSPDQPCTSGPLGVISLAFLSTHGPLAEYCTSRKGSLVSPSPTMLSSSSDWLMRCSRR